MDVNQQQEEASLQTAPPPPLSIPQNVPTIDISGDVQDNIPVISLTEENNPPQLTADGIQNRARTIHYALQDKSPGTIRLERVVQENREHEIRTAMAFEQKMRQEQAATAVIRNLVSSRKGEKLTPEEEKLVYDTAREAGNVDPETIVEKVWANNYVRELMHTPAQLMMAGLAAAPVATMGAAGTAVKVATLDQVALSVKQKYDKMWEELPVFDAGNNNKAEAWVRVMIPGMYAWATHDLIEGSKQITTGILPGQNIKEQKELLALMGPEKAKPLLEKAAAELWKWSPRFAMEFLDNMISYPEEKASIDNAMGIVDVATAFPGTKIARGIVSDRRAAKEVIERSLPSNVGKETPKEALPLYAVKVNEKFVKNNEHILFSPAEVKELVEKSKLTVKGGDGGKFTYVLDRDPKAFPEYGSVTPEARLGTNWGPLKPDLVNGQAVKIDQKLAETASREAQTARNPRGMSPEELRKAADAFPEGASYPPSSEFYSRSTGLSEASGGMSVRGVQRIGEGVPGYSLQPSFDLSAFKAAVNEKNVVARQLDEAKRALEAAQENKAGDTVIAGRKAQVDELEKSLRDATDKANHVSVYTKHPAVARAEQGVRAYFSAGLSAMRTVPTGTGSYMNVGTWQIRPDTQGTLTVLGRSEEAIKTGAIRQASEAINPPTDPVEQLNSWGKDLPSTHRPNPFIENASSYTREGALRASDQLLKNAELLTSIMQGQRVQRLTEADLLKAYNIEAGKVKAQFSGNSQNSVLDQEMVYDPSYNLYYVKTKLGKTDATGFNDYASAQNTLQQQYGISPRDMYIKQEGNSFYGFVVHPIDESGTIKSAHIATGNNNTPSFWGMNWSPLRKVRSADATTSPLQMQARLTATHAPQHVIKIINDIANSVKFVGKEKDELGHVLMASSLDRDKNGNLGRWWDKSEIVAYYTQKYGKMPSDNIIEGYATYRQLMDLDYEMRKNYVYSFWTREGYKHVNFDWEGGSSPQFYGKIVDKFGHSKVRDRGILYIDKDGKASYKWTDEDYKNNKDGWGTEVDRLIKEEGYQIIQLGQPLKHPLKEIKGGDVYFVLTNKGVTKNINPEDVLPYRGGPHIAYTHGHFIGQALIIKDAKGQATYAGDQIFRSGGPTGEGGRAWALKYDTARKLMNTGDDQALADFLRDNLPESVEDFKKLFIGENALDRNLPIAWHPHGRNILDSNPGLSHGEYNGAQYNFGELKDFFSDLSNPEGKLNSGFLQERANQHLMVPKDLGNVGPARFQLESAPILDPFISINRGLRQANRVRFMEDYKILAAESFIKEFGHYIQNASREALERNPMHYLYEGKIDSGAPHDIQGKMNAFRENVKNFIGMQSDLSMDLTNFETKMQDAMHRWLKENKTGKILETPFVQDYAVPFIKDPAYYARAAAFKLRMGLFNPVQYWQQSQAVAAVLAISPKAGMEGAAIASYLQAGGRYALDDAAKLDYYAGMIAKSSRWTKDEAKEVLQAYKDSGIGIIGQETSYKNLFAEPKMFRNTWLDKGDMFFNHGEGFARDAAYFTAWREWKDANPGRIANQYDLGSILRRSNDMTFSMTRASNSSLQNNTWASIPLQFQTFRIRQAELMMGGLVHGKNGRISREAAGRMLGTYATLYGIPVAVSAPIGIYSFYDDIRQHAIERGYNLDNAYFKAMHEGLLALITYSITGKNLNFATAWGPGGSSLVNDIWAAWKGKEGSKSLGELIAGPVGGSFQSAVFATTPVWRWAWSRMDDEKYPLTAEDYIRFLTVASSTDNARSAWQAYNLGKEFTKKGMYVGDVTTWDGVVKAIFGLSQRELQDAFLTMKDVKEIRGWQENAKNEIRALYQSAFHLLADGEEARADEKFMQIKALTKAYDIPMEDVASLMTQTGDQSLVERLNSKLYRHPKASVRERNINTLMNGDNQ